MKKANFTEFSLRDACMKLMAVALFVCSGNVAFSQCDNGTNVFPAAGADVPVFSGIVETITTCNFSGELTTIRGAQSGTTYEFASSIATDFFTIRDAATNNVLASGTSPLSFTATSTGDVEMHINFDNTCGSDGTCRETTVECTSCPAPPSPPANDECAGASPLMESSPVAGPAAFAFDAPNAVTTFFATQSPEGNCSTFSNDDDVWFSFTPANTGSYIFQIDNVVPTAGSTASVGGFAVYDMGVNCSTPPGTANDLFCDFDGEQAVLDLMAGESYLVRAWTSGQNGFATYDLSVALLNAPTNDECGAAIDIPLSAEVGFCDGQTSASNFGATDSNGSFGSDPTCDVGPIQDIWYTMSVPASGDLTILIEEVGFALEPSVEIYTGNCGAATSVFCDTGFGDITAELTGLTPLSTVLIRLWDDGGDEEGEFLICGFETAPIPANDDCAGAITITESADGGCANSVNVSTLGATQTAGVANCTGFSDDDDVWYTFTPATTGQYVINLTNIVPLGPASTVDETGFAVFDGDCGTLNQLYCDFDGLEAIVDATAGTPLLLQVFTEGQNGNATFDLCVYPFMPLTGGVDCNAAVAVDCGTTGVPTAFNGTATNSFTGFTGATDATFYSYTAPADGSVVVNSCAATTGIDTRLTVHETSCPNPIGGDDDDFTACTANGLGSLVAFDATCNTQYFLEWDDRWGEGPFNFDVTFTCAEADAIDLADLGQTDAGLTWANFAACNATWTVEYGLAGFTPGTGTSAVAMSAPFNISNLTPDTDYDVYVTNDCLSAGACDGGDATTAFFAFTTLPPCQLNCSAAVSTVADVGECSAASITATAMEDASSTACDSPTIRYERSDNAGVEVPGNDASGTYPVGVTTVTFRVDLVGGTVPAECTINITVLDTQAPTITCPADAVVTTSQDGITGDCFFVADASFDATGVDDNCAANGLTVEQDVDGAANLQGVGFFTGMSTVTYTVTDDSGNTADCSFNITVSDDENPDLVCPSSVTLQAGPGECSVPFIFDLPTFTDNCPLPLAQGVSYEPIDNATGAGSTFDMVTFDLTNQGTSIISVTGLIQYFNIGGNVNYEVFTAPTNVGNNLNAGAWTSVGAGTANSPGAGMSAPLVLSSPITLAPGQTIGVAVTFPAPVGFPMQYTFPPVPGTTADPNGLLMTSGGATTTPFAGTLLTPRGWNGEVIYDLFSAGAANLANQTDNTGLTSGSEFPVNSQGGPTTLTYNATDLAGNVSDCAFTITVLEFANPVDFLTCNDQIQVSLDEDCEAIISADQVLEGGPYGCYDDYTVNVVSPQNQELGNFVTGAAIGETWTVKVTDNDPNSPSFGVSCWGTLVVEDKIDPVITACEDITVFCNTITDVGADGFFRDNTTVTPGTPVGAAAAVITIPVDVPSTSIVDLNISLNIPHTWIGDLEATLTSPSGTVVNLFDEPGNPDIGPFGCPGNDMDVTFDDEASRTAADFEAECNNAPASEGAFQPLEALSAFDGEDPNGDWVLNVNDVFAAIDDGTVDIVTISIGYNGTFPGIDAADACGAVTLDASDNFTNLDCGDDAGSITRFWTVTDESGNSTTCSQVITLARPSLDDLQFPGDRDGVENPSFDCGDSSWDINGNGYPDATADEGGIVTLDEQAITDLCDISCEYSDNTLEVCEGTTKILRTWTCVDWCAGQEVVATQILKVADETGPAIGSSLEDAAIFRNTAIVEAFVDVYESSAPGASAHNGCAGNVVIPPAVMCNDLNGDGTVDRPEDVDGDGRLDVFEDLNGNGVLDNSVNEDVNGNGFLDIGEDLNGNDILETNLNEDLDFDGNLDVDEDLDGDGKLDLVDEDPDGDGQWDCGDNCSSIVAYTTQIWSIDANQNPVAVLGESNTNGAVFNDLELVAPNNQQARYAVRYVAEDACGNASDLIIIVILEDRIPPVAICDEITEVTVINNNGNSGQTGDGCTAVPAESFDDGSYDNCTEVYFLAAQMPFPNFPLAALQFRPTVDFCCSDVGQDNVVVLLTLDRVAWENYQLFVSLTGNDALFGALLDGPAYRERYNSCMVEVNVDDKIAPVVTSCPDDFTILCDVYWDTYEAGILAGDYSLLDADFGTAVIFDNCDVNLDADVDNQVNQCGEGAIVRTWSAEDNYGNQSGTCTQKINVLHVSDWVVTFPEDVELDCPAAGLDTMAVESQFGEPEIKFETCELIAVSYEDEYFDDVPNACLKVNRNWVVINWCVVGDEVDNEANEMSEFMMWNLNGIPGVGCLNGPDWPEPNCDLDGDGDCDETTFRDSWTCNGPNPVLPDASLAGTDAGPDTDPDLNPWDGYIAYQQTIKIQDSTAPVFTDCGDVQDECIFNGCTMTVDVVFPEATDCNEFSNVEVVIESSTLPNFNAATGRATDVPVGTYTVVFKASDNCGNWEVCEKTIVVEDCKKPTPYCKDGIVVGIMNTTPPMIEVWATDLNDGSFDNCGIECISFAESCDPADQVVTYTCDDIGTQTVEMWIRDINGNWDYCETEIIVQDQMGNCEDDLFVEVGGNIATEDNDDIADVEVNINSNATDMTYTTDASGMFNFEVPADSDYTVTPEKDINHLNGVTTYDLVQISKHILNIDNLDSPYQMIAADANNSGTITTFDLVTIRKLILFIDTEFANNTSWRFIPSSYTFPDATNPWVEAFPEVINLNNLTADQLAQDFVGIKIGDVNNSANANELLGADDRSKEGALTLATNDIEVEAGKTYTVEFTANNFDHLGYQFTMNYEGLEFVEVVSGVADADNFGTSLVSENVITASWHKSKAVKLAKDEVVFALTFKANTTAQLSDLLSINSRYTAAEAYSANGSFQDVNIEFNQTTVVEAGFELYQNTPNPFSESTLIGFNLPEATSATITISDVSGRVLRVIEGDYAKGYNQVNVTRSELPAVGVLYYQLDTDKDSATKKMILVD